MESVAVAASAAQYPIMGKSDVSVQEMVDYLTDQDELIRLQHWQQEGGFYRDICQIIMKRQLQKESTGSCLCTRQ